MNNIVICGGSTGFGKAMTHEFYQRNHNVLIAGRNLRTLNDTMKDIEVKNKTNKIHIMQCDVKDYKQVERLGKYAKYLFSNDIHHWINAAAICEGPTAFVDLSLQELSEVVSTNLLGTIYGCKVALNLNVKNIHNISGHGSDGSKTKGYPVYGASKAAISQFSLTLADEVNNGTNVHVIAPGIMKTKLTQKMLSNNEYDFVTRTLLEILSQDPNKVAKSIAPQVINIKGNGKIIRVK